ncbi:MAG: flagellar hook-associated protein FlgL [Pseudomonadota bacterium]
MTRVPTLDTFNRALAQLTASAAAAARAQEQIATGSRIVTPADDPYGAAEVLLFEQNLAELAQYSRNATNAEVRLQREEAALASVNDLLQRSRELVLQASNATQTQETRGFIAVELREIRAQLVDIANTENGRGRYLFAGNRDTEVPFVASGAAVDYVGDQGQRQIQIGESLFVESGDSGDQIFMRVPRANGVFTTAAANANTGTGIVARQSVITAGVYGGESLTVRFTAADAYDIVDGVGAVVASGTFAPGDAIATNGIAVEIDGQPAIGDEFTIAAAGYRDVFATLDDIATVLESGASSDAALAQQASALNRGLENLDQAIGIVLETRTSVGSRLESIDAQRDLNTGFELLGREALADLRDLDYTAAISQLSQQLTALEAAQQAFVRTQGLSLFNVL